MKQIDKVIEKTDNRFIFFGFVAGVVSIVVLGVFSYFMTSDKKAIQDALNNKVIEAENHRLANERLSREVRISDYEGQLKLREFVAETYQESPESLKEMSGLVPLSMAVRLKKAMGEPKEDKE